MNSLVSQPGLCSKPPKKAIRLDEAKDYWNYKEGTLDGLEITFYSCVISLPGKTITFPLRYVNKGINYIQPISGPIALDAYIGGSIAFAYNFETGELLSEFSLCCHALITPLRSTLGEYIISLDILPKDITFYTHQS